MQDKKKIANLYPRHVRRIMKCSDGTVKTLEKKYSINPIRDKNGHRRYTLEQALQLKKIWELSR